MRELRIVAFDAPERMYICYEFRYKTLFRIVAIANTLEGVLSKMMVKVDELQDTLNKES